MTPYPFNDQLQGQGRCRSRHVPTNDAAAEGLFPLHRLSSICCSTGACRDVNYWPMGYPQDGWLQLDQDPDAAMPLELIAFSSRGVSVVLSAVITLPQGARGQLITQAHGAGLSHRPVRCCWRRAHPRDPSLQCAGLRFEGRNQPSQRAHSELAAD
jgi:hypothetical protein